MTSLFATCPCCNGSGLVADVPVPSAPARSTDPDTSHAASKTEPDLRRFHRSTDQAKILAALNERPMTHHEVAALLLETGQTTSTFDGCRRRGSDLGKVGFIADSGVRRRNAHSGKKAIVWQVTTLGHMALQRLAETEWSR